MTVIFLFVTFLITGTIATPNGAQYPAGVNPQSCPNYPNCDNAALHGGAPGASGAWSPHATPAWNSAPVAPSWNSAPAASSWNSPAVPSASAGAQYPAGVNPQSCPNYPNCDNAALHNGAGTGAWGAPAGSSWNSAPGAWNSPSAPAAHWNAAPAAPAPVAPQYPAGVSQHSCPNYPYC